MTQNTPMAMEETRPPERLLILEKGRAERNYWTDLWHYRELFAILAWRDISVRTSRRLSDWPGRWFVRLPLC